MVSVRTTAKSAAGGTTRNKKERADVRRSGGPIVVTEKPTETLPANDPTGLILGLGPRLEEAALEALVVPFRVVMNQKLLDHVAKMRLAQRNDPIESFVSLR